MFLVEETKMLSCSCSCLVSVFFFFFFGYFCFCIKIVYMCISDFLKIIIY